MARAPAPSPTTMSPAAARGAAGAQHLRRFGDRGRSGQPAAQPRAGSARRATRSSMPPAIRSRSPASTGSASRSSTLAPHGLWTRGYRRHDEPDGGSRLQHHPPALLQRDAALERPRQRHRLRQESGSAGSVGACRSWTRSSTMPARSACKIILDHHRSDSGPGTSPNGLWYDGQHSQAEWVSDWQMLASRLRQQPDRDRRRPAQRAAQRHLGRRRPERLGGGGRARRQRHRHGQSQLADLRRRRRHLSGARATGGAAT